MQLLDSRVGVRGVTRAGREAYQHANAVPLRVGRKQLAFDSRRDLLPFRLGPLSRRWQHRLFPSLLGDAKRVASAVRAAVRSVDPRQPIATPSTMDEIVDLSTAQRRVALTVFAFFSAIALLLAMGGVYGVMSGAVTERMREFGLRAALGANPSGILRLVLRDGLSLALVGLAIGGAGAVLLGRYLGSLLYAVEPRDPVTLGLAGVVVVSTSLLACVVPARRAARVDPMTALRSD